MPLPILATKIYIPPPRPKIVLRTRLIDQLNKGLSSGRRLTMIAAPAGFGKTTLVCEWITSCDRSVAWVSLDEGDNDPSRFLTYLISALQTVVPNIGEEGLHVLESSQSAPLESALATLLNEITTVRDNFILVLDDYHMLDSKPVDSAVAFLVEHQPPQMHLVITTREDPNLPLPRLRVRDQLTEIRAADLRFTLTEAAEFLNQVMEINLSSEDVAALETRTEGWVAGLQLAALSIRGQEDVHGFIQAFAGDHRYVVDYLVEEVLQRQPESVRNFLLQTSILDQLNGPLTDAVTGQTGGKAGLEALQRGNFFLIPLDDQSHWYRYHHLFGEVLHMHLISEQPEQIPLLHQRASEWHEQNGSTSEAIRHALAGRHFERAAGLIEMAAPAMHQIRQESTVLGWMKSLPEELFQNRPVLSVLYVGAIMSNGGLEDVEARLGYAERWLKITSKTDAVSVGMAVVNEDEFRRLPGAIAMYRAALALVQGDVPGTMTYAQQVFELLPEEDHLGRGAASAILGLASWLTGDLEIAHRTFADGMAHLQKAGNISDAVGGVLALADIRITQGRLDDAMRTYEQALQLARDHGTPTLRGTADMYVGMSEIKCERNDLDAAVQDILKSQGQGEHTGFPQYGYRWRVAMARIRQIQGDLDTALKLLEDAEPLYVSDFFPNVRPIGALKVRVLIALGKLEEALDWARRQRLSTQNDLSYLHEFEHITLVRILLAQYRSEHTENIIREVIALLDRLLKAAEGGERMGNVIEILILQSLAHQMLKDLPAALSSLERALKLAEPQGYVRIFVDEGAEMLQLIREAHARGTLPDYTNTLLSAFEPDPDPDGETARSAEPVSSSLIEPLSQRELDILRLFKTELSGPEIANQLVIALSTVRTHTKSIYNKLNVNSRRGAVRRAIELGLI